MDPERQTVDPNLLEEKTYRGEQSAEFDALLQTAEVTHARMEDQSELTKEKIIVSEWHVPCHCILAQRNDGLTQAFHAKPSFMAFSHLKYHQRTGLQSIGKIEDSQVIVAFSKRSHYRNNDRLELNQFGFSDIREIPVDTTQWWRILYNPKTNEIWIDDKIHRTLLKYRGFAHPEKDAEQSSPALPTSMPALQALLS